LAIHAALPEILEDDPEVEPPEKGGNSGDFDSVSTSLTRVMYARALQDIFGSSTGQGRPPFTRAAVQAWRAALEAKGLTPGKL
jgi:hypothetical protein